MSIAHPTCAAPATVSRRARYPPRPAFISQATGRPETGDREGDEGRICQPGYRPTRWCARNGAPCSPCTVGEGGEGVFWKIRMFSSNSRSAVTLLPVSLFICFAPAAGAQTINSSEVIVTANRWGESAVTTLSDVHVMTREDIERSGANSLPDLLARSPGVQSISYGGSNVYVRGSESRMTALYIDGVRIESHDGLKIGGGAPWGLIPLDMIERIEVVKGPLGALYGSDAMGGVVQVFTKQATRGLAKQISVGLGNQGTHQASASLSGAQDAFSYGLKLGERHSDGFNTRPDKFHVPNKEAWTNRFANIRLGFRLSPDHRLEWLTSATDRDEKIVAPYDGVLNIRQQSSLLASSLKWTGQWSSEHSSQVQLTHARNALKSDAPNLFDSPNDFYTVTNGFLAQHQFQSPVGRISALLEHKSDSFLAMPTAYDPRVQASRSQGAAGLGYALVQGAHSFRLHVRSDHYDVFSTRNTYAASYGWSISPSSVVIASRSTGFRAPTLEQTHGPYGSLSLKPESNTSNEIALERKNAGTKWRATLFDNKVDNLISSSQFLSSCAAGFFCYFNVGSASLRGLTLAADAKFKGLTVNASYDYLDAVDEVRQKRLSLRAKDQFRLSVNRSIEDVNLGAQINVVGRRFDDAANTVQLPGYAVLNLFIQKRLNSEWTWLARINNVADHRYQQMGCTPGQCIYAAQGRAFFTSVTWRPKD